jgi:hypothetical protein
MLIKSNTQDWHCRMIVNQLWKIYLKSINSDLNDDSNFGSYNDYNLKSDNYNLKKSPVSAPTIKCENRRKLDMDCEMLNKNTSNITDL